MRKFPFIISSLLSIALFSSCKKEFKPVAEYDVPENSQAKLKINFASVYRANPNVQIKVNDVRVSNLLTARTPFPGGGFNTGGDNRPDYLALNPGSSKIGISIPKANTNVDSVNVFSTNLDLANGKYYSLHVADTAANTKFLLVEDDAVEAPAGFSKYRFINLMPNVPFIDLYYGTTLMASRVPYLGTTNTFLMQVPATGLAWTIREAGTAPTSTALATYTSTNTTQSTRSYTAFAIGYKIVAGNGVTTTDARRPFVAFYLNR